MKRLVSAAAAMFALRIGGAMGAEPDGVTNRTIGYVLTDYDFATYQTPDGKTECPDGYNDGPREVYAPQHTHPHPRPSPDGSRVLYTSDASGHAQLYEVML